MSKKLTNKQGEAVGLTKDILSSMQPISELDPDFITRFKKAKKGRPHGRNKAVVSISMDKDLLDILRHGGAGWQSRVNALLRAAVGLHLQ